MILLLYRVLQAVVSPFILVYFLYRGLREHSYVSTLPERLGFLPPSWKQTAAGAIWLHAVSVGEVLAAIPLLRELRSRRPNAQIFVSTTTLAGHATAQARLSGLTDGVLYAPYDFAWCARRVLRHLKPSLVLVMETEIWPNLFREVTRLGAGLLIVNGRISDKALPRYKRFARLFRPVLKLCDGILVQSPEMRERYLAAGASPGSLAITGNLKYDFVPAEIQPDSPVRAFLAAKPSRLWIAASTSGPEVPADSGDEETAVLEAYGQLQGWRLILAPRKPDRFNEVAGLLDRSGLHWTKRTALDARRPEDLRADVLLLDTVGELSGLFAFADVVFMGGSLVNRGGHNILEPAWFGKPVIAGPSMQNFREITEHFEEADALLRVQRPGELAAAVNEALRRPEMGQRARIAAESKTGAAVKTASAVLAVYDSRFPADRPPQPWYFLGFLLATLWRWGSAYDRREKQKRSRRLPIPVVSVGNITAGGTGKTPVTIELLERLEERRITSGLLLRGHRRTASKPVVIPGPERSLPLSHTGDEAQLYLRRLKIPVGIYRDRFKVGQDLMRQTGVRILLLDDAFQHLQLQRDFDLVLVDALHPFGGGHLLPLGRLREPLDGLARAQAFVITRSDEVPCAPAIESVLRRYNPHAPVYYARTVAREWRTFGDRKVTPEEVIGGGPIVAFCGLGNPHSFWRTLRQLGIFPVEQLAYDDHHRYTPAELRRLARHAGDLRAVTLVTTAKDAVNLCEGCENICGGLSLFWLEIGVEIENGDVLFDRIRDLATRPAPSPV